MKITYKQVVLRVAAATGFMVGASLAACSSTDTPAAVAPPPATGGTSTTTGGTSAGTATAAGTTTGGAAAGTGTGGTGGAGKCPGNQVMKDGMCICAPFAPLFCSDIPLCVTKEKDPDHCGDCKTKCGPMNACAAGVCTPDLATVAEVTGCGALELVSTASKLYALGTMSGLSSTALPAAAGAAMTPIGATFMGGTAFAVDASNAYVAAGKDLLRIKLAAAATDMPEKLVTETMDTIYDVALDGMGNVFYASGTTIKKVPVTAAAGSTGMLAATAIDHGQTQGITWAGGYLLYGVSVAFNVESCNYGAAGMVCNADATTGDTMGPGVEVKIGASQDELLFGHRSVQADATNVYWANHGVVMAPYTGAGVPAQMTIAAPIDTKKVIAYAVDGAAKMTYIATDDGSLEKSAFDKGGEDAVWVARALPTVTSIVLDPMSVYLASACKILKSAR